MKNKAPFHPPTIVHNIEPIFDRKKEITTPQQPQQVSPCLNCPLFNSCIDFGKVTKCTQNSPSAGIKLRTYHKRKITGRIMTTSDGSPICHLCNESGECSLQNATRNKCSMFTKKGRDVF